MLTIIVDDLDALVTQIVDRGLESTKRETYANGVRKVIYCDPDGTRSGSAAFHARRTSRDADRYGPTGVRCRPLARSWRACSGYSWPTPTATIQGRISTGLPEVT